jgi:hypothetical protein
MSFCLPVCLSACLSVLTIYLSFFPSVCLLACLIVCQSFYRSIFLLACLSVSRCLSFYLCLSDFLSFCPSVSLSVCVSVCRSFCLSVFLSFFPSFCFSICLPVGLSAFEHYGILLSSAPVGMPFEKTLSSTFQMRNSRIIPILIQMLHGDGSQLAESQRPSRDVRLRVARALHNIVHAHPTDKQCKREARVLRLLETLRIYSDFLRDFVAAASAGQGQLPDVGCSPICIRVVPGGEKSTGNDLLVCGKLDSFLQWVETNQSNICKHPYTDIHFYRLMVLR